MKVVEKRKGGGVREERRGKTSTPQQQRRSSIPTRELRALVAEHVLLPARKRQVADVVKETVVAVQDVDRRLLALQTVSKGVLEKR